MKKHSIRILRMKKLFRRKWSIWIATSFLILFASINISYAGLDPASLLGERYEPEKMNAFNNMDNEMEQQLIEKKEVLREHVIESLKNYDREIEKMLEDTTTAHSIKLHEYYSSLISQLDFSKDKEKEAFAVEAKTIYDRASQQIILISERLRIEAQAREAVKKEQEMLANEKVVVDSQKNNEKSSPTEEPANNPDLEKDHEKESTESNKELDEQEPSQSTESNTSESGSQDLESVTIPAPVQDETIEDPEKTTNPPTENP
ncbi:hypothetical protein [Peribacillus alkalitolerans]|uniref:hypothetical protein n=1 Tax=Peribacillus alkalitolerans TaxID=1550385 RepID=UPI0013D64B54|nr:hypothetical protein [Peribacillus alkalitolerans]